eukprot:601839-Rhodomonas_salina.1
MEQQRAVLNWHLPVLHPPLAIHREARGLSRQRLERLLPLSAIQRQSKEGPVDLFSNGHTAPQNTRQQLRVALAPHLGQPLARPLVAHKVPDRSQRCVQHCSRKQTSIQKPCGPAPSIPPVGCGPRQLGRRSLPSASPPSALGTRPRARKPAALPLRTGQRAELDSSLHARPRPGRATKRAGSQLRPMGGSSGASGRSSPGSCKAAAGGHPPQRRSAAGAGR